MPVNQSVPHNWRYAFDSFVVGPTNDMAYAAARNMARSGAAVDTLFLSSGPGLGKTHLTPWGRLCARPATAPIPRSNI